MVNVDEIKVGDLVEYQSPHFEDIRSLGVVTKIGDNILWGLWSDEKANKKMNWRKTNGVY